MCVSFDFCVPKFLLHTNCTDETQCVNFLSSCPQTPPVGPSLDPSAITFIDTIMVYVKSKEAFGWPEQSPDTPPLSTSPCDGSSPTDTVDKGSEVIPLVVSKGYTAMDR